MKHIVRYDLIASIMAKIEADKCSPNVSSFSYYHIFYSRSGSVKVITMVNIICNYMETSK